MRPINEVRSSVQQLLKRLSVKVAGPNDPPFTLASGGTSRFYLDVKKTSLNHEAHVPLAALIYNALVSKPFYLAEGNGDVGLPLAAVAGVVLGGCHLASTVAFFATLVANHPFDVVYVRKEAKDHGTKNLVERCNAPLETPLVLLEDVITTGASSIRALQSLKETGYHVRGTVAVIDRRAPEARTDQLEGLPLRSLFTLEDFAL